MSRTRNALGALALATLLAPPAPADTAEVLAQIQADFIAQRQVFDQHRREFALVRRRASEVKVDLRISRDAKLDLDSAPRAFGPLDSEDMLAYLPEALLRDLRQRLGMEYLRGGDEWLAGYWPPVDYQAHSGKTIRWTREIFHQWDQETFVFGLPLGLSSLYVEAAGTRAASGDFDRLTEQLPALRRAAENALDAVEEFEPDVEWGWTWYPPFRKEKLKNKDEWEPLRRQAEIATNNYRNALVTMRDSADSHVRQKVEQAVDYEGGARPALGFLSIVAGLGTPSRYGQRHATGGLGSGFWNYWFDEQVLRALPRGYLAPIQDRLISAYFLGARDAKHDRRARVGTGNPYGTGDGYGWGDDTRYRASGSRRTPGSWDRGTGSGSTGHSTGGTGGTGSPGGTDHGPWIPGPGTGDGGLFGTGGSGSGTGSSGSGTGTGSGSGGTGSG